MTLEEKAIEFGKELFHELWNEHISSNCVGASDEFYLEFEGETYIVKIDAFWEKAHHFSYHISGNGVDKRGMEYI